VIKFRVVDLFCGAGGLSLGFRNAGFDLVLSADNDNDSIKTYQRNLGNHALRLDLSAGTTGSIGKLITESIGAVDVLIGGPPCQGFSIQRRGDTNDDRNDLLLRHVRIGISVGAKCIVFENVPTVLGPRGHKHVSAAITALEKAGYTVKSAILQAADYGVPQLRRRAFVVAIEKKLTNEFYFPYPTHTNATYRTVRDAIADLPEPAENCTPDLAIPNHQRRNISALNLERLSHVPEGGGRLDIPPRLRLACHSKDNGHRHLDVYGRMWWDKSAPTITAMFDNFTRGRFGHPTELRNITNREGARLQSFPDSFAFSGDQKSVARQIGNAVPPLLGEAVARAVKIALTGEMVTSTTKRSSPRAEGIAGDRPQNQASAVI